MFITFEGIDGSGKSTQIKKLSAKLRQGGAKVQTFRDPGGPEVSERVRKLLLNPEFEIDPVTELLLFSSARSQLMADSVLPNLKEGSVVILDRFYDSTTAYQGYGRESVPLNEIYKLNTVASHGRQPDVTIYMKLSHADAKERLPGKKDRMEQAGNSFFNKVINGFNKLAETEDRFFTVDATRPAENVHEQIWGHVQSHVFSADS